MEKFAVPEHRIDTPLNYLMLQTAHRKELGYLKFYDLNMRDLVEAVD